MRAFFITSCPASNYSPLLGFSVHSIKRHGWKGNEKALLLGGTELRDKQQWAYSSRDKLTPFLSLSLSFSSPPLVKWRQKLSYHKLSVSTRNPLTYEWRNVVKRLLNYFCSAPSNKVRVEADGVKRKREGVDLWSFVPLRILYLSCYNNHSGIYCV